MPRSLMQRSLVQRSLVIIIISVLLHLGGCACLTGYKAYPVISSPQASLLNKRITHLIRIDTDEQSETFIAVLELHADKTQLVGLTTTGITLFTLEYTQAYQELNSSALYSDAIKPLQLLTELQLVNYSADNITQQLPEHWTLHTDHEQRWLNHKDNTRLEAGFFTDITSTGPVLVKNTTDDHTLTITRLSIEDTQ